jgi:hypothetical protein
MTELHAPSADHGRGRLSVLSFHDVVWALTAASFENRLLKRYIKNWPESDPAGDGEAGPPAGR